MTDRSFVGFRARVVRLGLALSWAALAWLAVTYRNDLGDPEQWIPVAVLGGGLAVLSVLPWARLLRHPPADALVVLWTGLAVYGLVVTGELGGDVLLPSAFVVVIVFGAATMVSEFHLFATVLLALAAYTGASHLAGVELVGREFLVPAGLLGAAGLLVLGLGAAVNRRLRAAGAELNRLAELRLELAEKETRVDRMYEVSRTIGVGSNLAEVLPELVGRVVGAVNAKMGLVLLYQPADEALELMSPIWVAGHTVRAEDYLLQLTEPGVAQRVFVSSEPTVVPDLASSGIDDRLLAELDAHDVAAVPLLIESRAIGVLLVADKAQGRFTREDLDQLQSLAGPSALVLNQMSRYEEARETGAKMAELAQLKTDFVSVVSHELRTPLTSIIGSLKTLERPELAPTDTNARDLLASASKQAERLRALIEDLLVVSRIDNRALPVRPQEIRLDAFLRDVVDHVPGADRRVVLGPSPDVPTIEVDPEHLRRILTNLVTNALKYAPGSSIELQARASGSEAWISVVDHGPGIPYELHDHVFDRFTQVAPAATRATGGTGLGLSIVRGLSEAMGGRVWFEPTIGGGATFTVALPRSPRSYAAGQLAGEPAPL